MSKIVPFSDFGGDPPAVAGNAIVYSKDVAGVVQVLARSSDGTVTQVTGGSAAAIGDTIASATEGSILFAGVAGVLAQDNANLFWDNSNNRLGLGTATPAVALDLATGISQSGIQFHTGDTLAVSAVNTGRIRYNTTGQKFQVSLNGAAYVDIATGAGFTLDIGDAIGSSTVGSMLFVGAGNLLAQDNANLFWDDTNNRLGLGTATPVVALDLATGTAEAGIQFGIGNTLPVSAANTGRLRYNTTGQKFQVSLNGAAYVDLATGVAGVAIGDTVTGATAGSVLFAGAAGILQQDNTSFFWNDTNNVLQLTTNHATTGPLNIRASAATAPSAIALFDNNNSFRGYFGWFNTSYNGYPYMNNRFGILSIGGEQIVFGSQFSGAHVFGTQNTAVFYEMYQGGAAAVAPAATGRIQLNGVKFQVSANTGAYFDVGTYAAPLTTGSVLFANASNQISQDNANFFWDDTNNRLGIGTTAPAFPLDVRSVVGNTAGRFGADWPMTMVQGTAFSVSPAVGYAAYYNGGWRFADGPLFNYAAYTDFNPSTVEFGWYRSNQGLGAGTLWSSSTLVFQITAAGSIRVPGLQVFSPSGNWRGIPLINNNGTFGLDMASNELIWDFAQKRLCLGTNPDWAGATISIRKGFGLQLQTRSTVALGATSGSMIAVSVETTPTGANQRLGEYTFGSYFINIITPVYGAGIEAFAEAAWTAGTSHPSYLIIKTAVSGSATPIERMRFPSDGSFQMPNSAASVSAASTGRLRYNSGTQTFQASLNGGAYADLQTGAEFTLDIGDAIGSSTVGSVLFAGAGNVLAQDNANFFWDDTNNRLGIGTAAPTNALDVRISHSGNGTVRVQNTHAIGYSTIDFYTNGGTHRFGIGHDNALNRNVISAGLANNDLYLAGVDGGLATSFAHQFGMAFDGLFYQMLNGSSAAVGAANTGRLRYNTTGQKFQVSGNAAAYFDVGTYAAALTAGSILFANASNQIAQDNANFFWDDTNNRLGIGTATPAAALHVTTGPRFDAAIDLSNIAAGSPNLNIVATSDTPTVTWGAAAGNEASTTPAGYLEIVVGGSPRYIPFWA